MLCLYPYCTLRLSPSAHTSGVHPRLYQRISLASLHGRSPPSHPSLPAICLSQPHGMGCVHALSNIIHIIASALLWGYNSIILNSASIQREGSCTL